MSSNSLASASPASTVGQLLHIGTGTLAAGAPLRLGDGSATILTLSTTGLTIAGTLTAANLVVMGSSSAGITLTRLGTVARSQALADAPGTLHPVIRAVVNATTINSTTTPANLPLTWENGSALQAGTYRVRGHFACQSSLTTTGVQLSLNGPASVGGAMALVWYRAGAVAAVTTAFNVAYAPTAGSAIASTPFLQTVEGLVTLTLDASPVPSLTLTSSAASTLGAQVYAGSFIEFERVL